MKKKRVNKDKTQIAKEMAYQEKVKAEQDRVRYIAKTSFPFVEKLKTVYDAQTVFNAASGYVATALAEEVSRIKVRDLIINLSTEKTDPELHKAVAGIVDSMQDISAEDVAEVLQKMGQKVAEFVANKGLKEKMTIKTSDFVA